MRVLRNFVKMNKPNRVALMEPKISGDHADRVCKSSGFANWVRVEAIGFSGGL